MAKYLFLIYQDESAWEHATPEVGQQTLAAHEAFGAAHGSKLRGGDALERSATATSVRPDGAGGFTVTDGPFVETKEAIGGYYVVEAADLDEAISLAKQTPATFGGIEVRPVRTFD